MCSKSVPATRVSKDFPSLVACVCKGQEALARVVASKDLEVVEWGGLCDLYILYRADFFRSLGKDRGAHIYLTIGNSYY